MERLLRCISLLLILSIGANAVTVSSQAKTTEKEVTLNKGKTWSVYKRNCTYRSNNEQVAYVSSEGMITAKRAGNAVVSVRKNGQVIRQINVTVKSSARLPNIGVCYDEMDIGKLTYEMVDNEISISQTFSNHGSATIKKLIVDYEVQVGVESEVQTNVEEAPVIIKQEWTGKELGIAPGKSVDVHLVGQGSDFDHWKEIVSVTVKRIQIYSFQAKIIVKPEKDKWTVQWGKPDTTKPVLSGLIGKDAYNKHYKDVYRTVYKGNKEWLRKYVSAYDDRDGKVQVEVDASGINWNKAGTYYVVYSATDSSGNVAREKTKVQVRLASNALDRSAKAILDRIVQKSYSDEQKARAIYWYVRDNMNYSHRTDHSDWEKAAQAALTAHAGDCFYYYSLGRLLLTRCGIPNQTITRVRTRDPHWWNYAYMENKGWYHYDTTPRVTGGEFCLKTSAWISNYSKRAGNSHVWNHSWIPASAKDPI